MQHTVEVGTKLRKKDAPDFVLEVIELYTPKGEQPHARTRISVMKNSSDVRLYSISALADPKLFIPVTADTE
jgi:hypothetical protein